jgi:hypothetical protein
MLGAERQRTWTASRGLEAELAVRLRDGESGPVRQPREQTPTDRQTSRAPARASDERVDQRRRPTESGAPETRIRRDRTLRYHAVEGIGEGRGPPVAELARGAQFHEHPDAPARILRHQGLDVPGRLDPTVRRAGRHLGRRPRASPPVVSVRASPTSPTRLDRTCVCSTRHRSTPGSHNRSSGTRSWRSRGPPPTSVSTENCPPARRGRRLKAGAVRVRVLGRGGLSACRRSSCSR